MTPQAWAWAHRSSETDRVGYHVTAARNRESIRERGLLPDAQGWDAGYVWFFADADSAIEAARKGWGGARELDIWSVALDGVDVIEDPHPGLGGALGLASRAVAGPLAPNRLTLAFPAP